MATYSATSTNYRWDEVVATVQQNTTLATMSRPATQCGFLHCYLWYKRLPCMVMREGVWSIRVALYGRGWQSIRCGTITYTPTFPPLHSTYTSTTPPFPAPAAAVLPHLPDATSTIGATSVKALLCCTLYRQNSDKTSHPQYRENHMFARSPTI